MALFVRDLTQKITCLSNVASHSSSQQVESRAFYCVVHLLSEGVPSREDASTSWPSSSGIRGHRRTYLAILESAGYALFKMVWYVFLRPLRPELDGQAVEASSREDTPSSSRWTTHNLSVFMAVFFYMSNGSNLAKCHNIDVAFMY
jgi:hypothetical protein